MLNDLLDRNAVWSQQLSKDDPYYFARLARHQTPEFCWVGCYDSRVPANVAAGLDPDEVFVHRNAANIIRSSDMNKLSALEFAVDTLKRRDVIVYRHYDCGDVKTATEGFPHGLAELNVIEAVLRVAKTAITQGAWASGAAIRVHGLIYGFKDRRLRDLDFTVGPD